MIGEGEGKFEIVTVPIIDSYKNLRTDSVLLKFGDHNTMSGTGSITVVGYEKIDLTYPLDGLSDVERTNFFKTFLQKGNNKFIIDSLSYDHLYDRDKPLRVNYNYNIGDYGHTNADELYVNMQLDKSWQNLILDSTLRTAPKEIDYKNNEVDVTILDLPSGYTADCLPSDRKFGGDDFGFDISYREVGNKIIATKKVYINTLMIEPSQFAQWNEFIAKLTDAYSENITLKKLPQANPVPEQKKTPAKNPGGKK